MHYHFISVTFNLILSSHLCQCFPLSLFPSCIAPKTVFAFVLSLLHATCPTHFICLDFVTLVTFGKDTNEQTHTQFKSTNILSLFINLFFNYDRFGFHYPPFNSIHHLHLHAISPASSMSFVSRLIFRPDSWWFVSVSIHTSARLLSCCKYSETSMHRF
jgi:hypothetical protein